MLIAGVDEQLGLSAATDFFHQRAGCVDIPFQCEERVRVHAVNLDRHTVKDVMLPRAKMAAIPDDLSLEEMVVAARKLQHRRLPMYDETPDTIVGILNTRALLLDPNVDLSEAIEFPSFVPETMNLLQLFKPKVRNGRMAAASITSPATIA